MSATRTIALVCVLCCLSATSHASPVTYDFTATMNAPINGSNQISGSFTFDNLIPLYPGGGGDQGPIPYPATLNFADHSITTAPDSLFNSVWYQDNGSSGGSLQYSAQFNDAGNAVSLTITLDTSSPNVFGTSTFEHLPTLNLQDWNSNSISIGGEPGNGSSNGTLTSLELVPNPSSVPEPSTMAVFVVLGVGLLARRLRQVG